jgi:hypothetical protein
MSLYGILSVSSIIALLSFSPLSLANDHPAIPNETPTEQHAVEEVYTSDSFQEKFFRMLARFLDDNSPNH